MSYPTHIQHLRRKNRYCLFHCYYRICIIDKRMVWKKIIFYVDIIIYHPNQHGLVIFKCYFSPRTCSVICVEWFFINSIKQWFFSLSYLTDFTYFCVNKKSKSCWIWSEQVNNDLFERQCRWFQLFFNDFQLFYFITRIIPD